MGKIRQGILDGFVGKVGTVVGSFWKGKKVMRAYNEFVANPRTNAQQLQRAKFAVLGDMGGAMNQAIKLGLHNVAQAKRSTPIGEFVRLNMANLSGQTPQTLEVDYASVVISAGDLGAVMPGELNLDTPLAVKVPIEASNYDQRFNSQNDKVYAVVYNKTKNQCVISDGTATRSSSDVDVTVPGFWQGDYVECWLFCTGYEASQFRGQVSETVYVGEGRIA